MGPKIKGVLTDVDTAISDSDEVSVPMIVAQPIGRSIVENQLAEAATAPSVAVPDVATTSASCARFRRQRTARELVARLPLGAVSDLGRRDADVVAAITRPTEHLIG